MSVRRYLVLATSAVLCAAALTIPAAAAAAAAPATLYVSPDGSDTNACVTRVEPCRTINHAVALAADSGTTIHLAKGTYDTASPGSKDVTVVGVGTDHTNGSYIAEPFGAAVVVNDPQGVLRLKSLAVAGDPVGAYVTAGKLITSHVSMDQSPCGIFMTAGAVTLTDSRIYQSGAAGEGSCSPLTNSPVAVTVNGGTLTMNRTSLVDTKDEPGIVVNAGTFSANDAEFSDQAYTSSNYDAAVQIAGGAATFARSLFYANQVALAISGGSTTITDSTFDGAGYGISSVGGGHQPAIFRSTLVDAPLVGPAVLAGDVLVSHSGTACSEQPLDLGYNYGTKGQCDFVAPTSHNGVATLNLLSPAADHGGPTMTVALKAPSALINTIPAGATWGPEHRKLCPAGSTDQRGVPRPQGGGCDVGAFEAAATRTVLSAAPNPAAPGASVTLTARVGPDTGTFHSPDPVTGKVTFTTGSTVLCRGQALNAAGVATCTTTHLPAGTPRVSATFTSNSSYLRSAGTATAVIGTTPAFTSADHASATVGKRTSFTVHTSGTPKPTVSKAGGTLPKGMTFTGGTGSATITGTPARGTDRSYVLHLRAGNVRGSAVQTFTLEVGSG